MIREHIRENNYDLIRVFAMFMVIMNHVADYYLIKTDYTSKTVFVYEGISHCAIPLFLMLTGGFLLNKATKINLKQFYIKALKKLMIPTAIFIIIYWIHDYKKISVTYILSGLSKGFLGMYAHWYMFMLIGIYAVIPFILIIKFSIDSDTYEKLVLIYFIWCMLSRQLDDSKAAWTVGNSMTFLGYVMMGDLIKNKITVINNKKGLLMCLLGIALLAIDYFILFVRVQHGDIYYNKWLSLYAAPLVILGSILVFSGGGMLELQRDFSFLSKQSFIVYLCHKLVIDRVSPFWGYIEMKFKYNFKIIIPIETVLVFLISLAVAIMFNWIIGVIENRNKGRTSNEQ